MKLNNKIAIISDIHCMIPLFEKVLKDVKNKNINTILFLGDYVTDGFENNKMVSKIQNYKYVIAGNRDYSVANYDGSSWKSKQYRNMLYAYKELSKENLAYLKNLPIYKLINLSNKKICMSHGSPYNIRDVVNAKDYKMFDRLISDYDCEVFLFGHTHQSFVTKYKNKLFINPGSLALSNESPTSKYGILDINTLDYEQISISYNFDDIKKYYLSTKYFVENFVWANLLLHIYKESSIKEINTDHCCAFIEFIINRVEKENINISEGFSNELWETSFQLFIKKYKLEIYK